MANSPAKDPIRELDRGLLERGRLALATLQYEEQAARYRAAYATLLEAISEAEHGNESRLRQWLDQRIGPTTNPTTLPGSSLESYAHPLAPTNSGTYGTAGNGSVPIPISFSPNQPEETKPLHQACPSSNPTSSSKPLDDLQTDSSTRTRSDRSSHAGERRCSDKHRFGQVVPVSSFPTGTSTSSNPWGVMELAATERLLYWQAPCSTSYSAERPSAKRDRVSKTGSQPDATLDPESLAKPDSKSIGKPNSPLQTDATVAILSRSLHAQSAPHRKSDSKPKRRRIASPDIWISILVHGCLLVCFSFWVIAVARPHTILSISASNIESDEVLLETPLESPTNLDAMDSTSIPTPEWKPPSELMQSAQVASTLENLAIGPPPIPAPAVASSMFGQSLSAMGAGTKLLEGVEFFGSKATGNTFVYVVDSSPSMRRDGAFEAAKDQILRSLTSMKPKQRFHVSFFGGELESMTFRGQATETGPIPANPENLSKTMEWIGRIKIQKDGRPPIDALQAAIAMQPDGIFLLFDGDTKVDNWTAKVREMNQSKDFLSDGGPTVPIHVIHFFRDEFEKSMRTLASENNGTYRFIPRPQKSPFQKSTP